MAITKEEYYRDKRTITKALTEEEIEARRAYLRAYRKTPEYIKKHKEYDRKYYLEKVKPIRDAKKKSRSEYIKKYRIEHPEYLKHEKEYQRGYYLRVTKPKREDAKTKSISP